jgi:hypothetical protein
LRSREDCVIITVCAGIGARKEIMSAISVGMVILSDVCSWLLAAAQIDFDIAGSWISQRGTRLAGRRRHFWPKDSLERMTACSSRLRDPDQRRGTRPRACLRQRVARRARNTAAAPSQYSFWGPARLRIESELDANLDVIVPGWRDVPSRRPIGWTAGRIRRHAAYLGRLHYGEWRGSTLV